jgi:hypothetical protein
MPGTYGIPLFWRGPYVMRVAAYTEQFEADGVTGRNQWLYDLEPVNWGTDYLYVAAADTPLIWNNCINIWEINNTSTTAMGLTVDPTLSTLEPAPVGAIVMVYTHPAAEDDNGIKPLIVFQWPNQWECV